MIELFWEKLQKKLWAGYYALMSEAVEDDGVHDIDFFSERDCLVPGYSTGVFWVDW